MKRPIRQLLFWTPRILCILFAGFLSIFAADVFGEHYGFWKTMLALLIHLIPTCILLIVLAVSWRWEWVGGILFIVIGIFYIVTSWGRFHWDSYVFIGGPPLLIGVLFLLNWLYRRELRSST
ncbi:MAG: hypothetical protein HY298_06645 [Verrucomicrobia bacterium]|nr:hypothetical protein [Verrucomicrobiota bacterium]